MPTLRDDEVHLWYLTDDGQISAVTLDKWRGLLTEKEIADNSRFTLEAGRREHLISHGFVREVLAPYLGLKGPKICFKKNKYGRPEIDRQINPPVHFNVSHSNGFYVCAVARSYEVGVDTESHLRETDTLGVAETVFSLHEREELKKLSGHAQQVFFYQIWTLKEAYIKARGMGVSLPLEKFSFNFRSPSKIEIKFEVGFSDLPDHWGFRLLTPQKDTQVACAYRNKASAAFSVTENYFNIGA